MQICCAVLAGGRGVRFKPYTDIVPKPMLPVGDDEKPVLEYIVSWITRFGIRDFVFLVGYRWKQIRNYFGDGRRFDACIKYSVDNEYEGTGGALLQAYKKGLFNNHNAILVWYGDILAPVAVDGLLRTHLESKAAATIAVAQKYQLPVGVARIDEKGCIVELHEKPWYNINVTIGVLVLDPELLGESEEELGKKFDLMGDYIPWLIRKGYTVKAYIHKGLWYDVGSLERYMKLPDKIVKAMKRQ